MSPPTFCPLRLGGTTNNDVAIIRLNLSDSWGIPAKNWGSYGVNSGFRGYFHITYILRFRMIFDK
jgi:hypothetical protein